MENGKLQSEKEILGNKRDDRYEERGNITYKELYLDNLPNRSKEIIISKVKNETVSLFKRLILGIDVDYYAENKNFENRIEILKNSLDNYSFISFSAFLFNILLIFFTFGYIAKDGQKIIVFIIFFYIICKFIYFWFYLYYKN